MTFRTRTRFFFFLILIFSSNIDASSKVEVKAYPCQIGSMMGNQPKELFKIVQEFKRVSRLENVGIYFPDWIPRVILHGIPGNGKTSIAREIADDTGSIFIHIKASSLVTSYQGSGAAGIEALFQEALEKIKEGKTVVILIDEVDRIASKDMSKDRQDSLNATTTLWCLLLEHEHNNRLFIIFATNAKDKLHPTLLSRFPTQNIIEMPSPDIQMRKDIIRHKIVTKGLPLLNKKMISDRYEDLDQQFCVKYAAFFKKGHELLDSINKAAIKFVSTEDNEVEYKFLRNLIMQWINNRDELFERIREDTLYADNKQAIDDYFLIIRGYLMNLKQSVSNQRYWLRENALDYLSQQTEGLSFRSVVYFMKLLLDEDSGFNTRKNDEKFFDLAVVPNIIQKVKDEEAKQNKDWSEEDRQRIKDLQSKLSLIESAMNVECNGFLAAVVPGHVFDCRNSVKRKLGYDKTKEELNEFFKSKK